MTQVRYRVLGPVLAERDGQTCDLGGPRQQMVLAYLLANTNRVVPQDSLIDAVWSGNPPPAAKSSLHTYISHLRHALGRDEISSQMSGYGLAADGKSLDSQHFEDLLDRARSVFAQDPTGSLKDIEASLALWYGRPYGDLGWEPALRAEAIRLDELRLVTVEHRIDAYLALGLHKEVLGQLQSLVLEHPYRERFTAQLMIALYRSGRQVEALRMYEACRQRFVDQLGVDPSPQLQDLEQLILHHDPGLAAPETRSERLRVPRLATIRGFEVRSTIWEAEFGAAYLAFQPSTGREVVLKTRRDPTVNDSTTFRSFESDAQAVSRLQHPHIVPLLDFWRDPDGIYLLSPYLPTGSLDHLLERETLPTHAATSLIAQIGDALSYAHGLGVVHGNLKRSNILLVSEDFAQLADFEIAPRRDHYEESLTAPGLHLAPEVIGGERPTVRSDIYAFAVLAAGLLGRAVGDLHGSLAQQLETLPPGVGDVMVRATDPDPNRRHQTVAELLDDLWRASGVTAEAGAEASPRVGVRNPYKGLRAFEEADSVDFHGRDALIRELVRMVVTHSLVGLVGPSGIGKSSVVGAGLIPGLKSGGWSSSEDWLYAEMHPDTRPFEQLELALIRIAKRLPDDAMSQLTYDDFGLARLISQVLGRETTLFLVVDQFEELFSPDIPETTRRLFLGNLVEALGAPGSRLRVILTLRADFFDHPLRYRIFADLLSEGLITVKQLSRDELTEAISGPAAAVGVRYEEGLIERIVEDFEEQPGALPLLQFALTELFEERDGSLLTVDAYERLGGVTGALWRRAEELYLDMDQSGREAVRLLFLGLMDVGGTVDVARRRVLRSELEDLPVDLISLDRAIRSFGDARLLTFDRDPVSRSPTVEIAHESMFRQWTRLAEWIDTHRDDLSQHQRLRVASQEWVDSGRDAGFLLRGTRLEQFEQWADQSLIGLTSQESDYLNASRVVREAEVSRTQRRRGLLIGSLAAGLLVTTTLGTFAVGQRRSAERQTLMATARELAAKSSAALDEDPELATLLALEAARVTESSELVLPEAIAALHRAVQRSRVQYRLDDGSNFIAASADGALLATDSVEPGEIVIWDASTGRRRVTLPAVGDFVGGVTFAPEGNQVAVAYQNVGTEPEPAVVIWDSETGQESMLLSGPPSAGVSPVFSTDGRLLAAISTSADGASIVTVWDLTGGSVQSTFPIEAGGFEVAFSATEGSLFVAEPTRQRVGVYDLANGTTVGELATPGFSPWHLALDPTGRGLAVADDEGRVQVWDLEESNLRFEIDGPGQPIAWSPDGGSLAAGDGGGVVVVDAMTGDTLTTLRTHYSRVLGVSFIYPGDRLASVAFGGEMIVWDVSPSGPHELSAVAIRSGAPSSWKLSSDGSKLAVSTYDGTVELIDILSGQPLATLSDSLGVGSGQFGPKISPDLRYVASMSPAGRGSVYSVPEFASVYDLPPCVTPQAFTEDGSLLAVDARLACVSEGGYPSPFSAPPGKVDLNSRIIDLDTGEVVVDLGERIVHFATFSRNGRYLASVTEDENVLLRVHDVATGAEVAALRRLALVATFSPSGDLLAWGSVDGGAGVIDLQALETVREPENAIVFERVAHVGQLVIGVALNAQGQLATAGSGDRHIRLWDTTSGEMLVEFETDLEEGLVPYLTFGADGRFLTYNDNGSVIRRYPLDNRELIELASNRATRTLTVEECLRYIGQEACP